MATAIEELENKQRSWQLFENCQFANLIGRANGSKVDVVISTAGNGEMEVVELPTPEQELAHIEWILSANERKLADLKNRISIFNRTYGRRK
jgi:hypothetical protein